MAQHQQPTRPGQHDPHRGPTRSRVVRPDDDKRTGQPPPEDIEPPDAAPFATAGDEIGDSEDDGQGRKHDDNT
jgi:hypothetical protein